MEHIVVIPEYTVTNYAATCSWIVILEYSTHVTEILQPFFYARVIWLWLCKKQFRHWNFGDIAVYMAVFCTVRYAATMFTFGCCNDNAFFVAFVGGVTHSTWRGTIYYIQVFAVGAWRPSATWPVEYKCFFTGFGGYIPQLLCFTEWRQECFHTHIWFPWNWNRIVHNTVRHWIAAGCQCCPHWRGDSWHTAQQHQVCTSCTHINQFFQVWHFTFVYHRFGETRVHTVNTQYNQFVG